MFNKFTKAFVMTLAFANLTIGCSGQNSGSSAQKLETVNAPTSMPKTGNFRLNLTDAPHPTLSQVVVNVDHIELVLAKGNNEGRLILAQGLGPIDLLKLRDGVHLPIADLALKDGVIVKQFRLILKEEGNFMQRSQDGSMCDLKTPSQHQSGLKLLMPAGGIAIENGQVYSLMVDFDVDHSIVDNPHGCLLKPVLKVKSLSQVPQAPTDSTDPTNPTDDSGTGDSSAPGDTTGDSGTTTGDTSTGGSTTDSGSATGDTSTGGGSSGGTDPTTGGTGGSTGVDPTDGAPVIIEGDPTYFY